MICPRCNAENDTDVGSCLNCGAPLPEQDDNAPAPVVKSPQGAPRTGAPRLAQSSAPPKACPSCSQLNAASFKFCARCGAPLGATSPTPPPPARAAPATPKPAP